MDVPLTARTHAKSVPEKVPKGKVHIHNNAYAPTLEDPSIIGPTAPDCTASPCDSQTDTIVVKNIAGNTEAIPAKIGRPNPEIHAEHPTAVPASRPLEIKTVGLTGLSPFGEGVCLLQAHKPKVMIKI